MLCFDEPPQFDNDHREEGLLDLFEGNKGIHEEESPVVPKENEEQIYEGCDNSIAGNFGYDERDNPHIQSYHLINQDQILCLGHKHGRSYTMNFEGFPMFDDKGSPLDISGEDVLHKENMFAAPDHEGPEPYSAKEQIDHTGLIAEQHSNRFEECKQNYDDGVTCSFDGVDSGKDGQHLVNFVCCPMKGYTAEWEKDLYPEIERVNLSGHREL